MALAMKTACCGKSLRTVTIILLYFHLIIHAWFLLSIFTKLGNSSYSQVYGISSGAFIFDIFFLLIGCMIFLATIISIYKEIPSFGLLTASFTFLVFSSMYTLFMLIVMNTNDTLHELYFEMVEEQARVAVSKDERTEYEHAMRSTYSTLIFFVNVLLVAGIAFKLYSALVFYSYREDLKTRPGYVVPPRQNASDPGAPPAPYQPNIQFAAPVYPTQPPFYPAQAPQQYPVLPGQYPAPPQYPYPPAQQYPQAPPQYEVGFK